MNENISIARIGDIEADQHRRIERGRDDIDTVDTVTMKTAEDTQGGIGGARGTASEIDTLDRVVGRRNLSDMITVAIDIDFRLMT